MAVGSSEKNYFTFVGGLNTEGSALNNPENTADVLENFFVELNGTLRKRPGLSISGTLIADGLGLVDVPLVSVHEWSAAVKGVKAEFFVVQVNDRLTVVSLDGNTVTRIGTMSLATYQRPSSSTVGTKRISAVSGKGNFFVTSPEIVPFFIQYDSLTNTISHEPITIQVRDFYGLEDGLGISENPQTLSGDHRYNLYNQGWTEERITKYKEESGVYPSNAQIWYFGRVPDNNSSNLLFRPQHLDMQVFGNSPAPKGHFVLNVADGSIASDEPPQLTYIRQEPDIVAVAVYQNTDAGSIYKWQRGTRLAGVEVGDVLVSQTDEGYTATVTSVGVDAGGNWVIAETSYFVDIPGVELNRGEDLAIYRPVSNVSVGTSAVFSKETVPSVTSFYSGRVFYSGASSTFWSNAVFYSQLVDKEDKVGKCYQDADPTSEHISDLIATDGGVLFIDSAVDIMAMIPYESSLVIFASNGVWELSGVNDDGFKATSFKIKKTSDFGAVGPSSIVSTGTGFVYWSESGIYALTREQISGSLQAASVSATTIQSLYDSINGAQKKAAKGFFDEVNKIIYWMYNSDVSPTQPNMVNKVLLLDTRLSAFYTLTFPWGYTPTEGGIVDAIKTSNNTIVSTVDLNVLVGTDTVVVGADNVIISDTQTSGSTYTGIPVGFLVCRPYGVQLHTLTSPTFYDFGVNPYEATIQTRYDLDGDALRKKHVLYVQPHFKKEVVVPREFTTNSVCALPTGWQEVAPMPEAREQSYGVVIGDYFYVFGGQIGGGDNQDSVFRYNRITNTWDQPTTMPYTARELVAGLLPNGFIYIAGGITGSGIGTVAQVAYWYDPYSNTWTAKSNLPIAWYDSRLGNLPDGRVIIFGGFTGSTTSYVYDSVLDTYALADSLPFAVTNHVSATMADGRIISVGGTNSGSNVLKTQIFDQATMSWSLGADQPVGHGNYPGVSSTPCGPVYMWGGGGALTGVSAYDPSTDTWSVLGALPFSGWRGAYGRFYDGQYIWASGRDASGLTAKTYLSATPIVE